MVCGNGFIDVIVGNECESSVKCVQSVENKSLSVSLQLRKINSSAEESSPKFKYVRSLEALFEATPQAVLQLVYVMRTGTKSFEAVFIISIIQSIISMTNSMLNEDNVYMTHPKWNSYKKRFIPHKNFLKHALFRCAEITQRICLFALFWTVVGGAPFSVLIGIEILFPIIYNIRKCNQGLASWNEFFLTLNIIIALPPEWIFELSNQFVKDDIGQKIILKIFDNTRGCNEFVFRLIMFSPVLLIIFLFHFVRYVLLLPAGEEHFYLFSGYRIMISGLQFIVIVITAFWFDFDNDRYLFRFGHGAPFFIICTICFIIYAIFYPKLMPDIRLKDHLGNNINIRSKLGYAYLGNIEELERIFDRFIQRELKEGYEERMMKTRKDSIRKREKQIMADIETAKRVHEIEMKNQGIKDKLPTLVNDLIDISIAYPTVQQSFVTNNTKKIMDSVQLKQLASEDNVLKGKIIRLGRECVVSNLQMTDNRLGLIDKYFEVLDHLSIKNNEKCTVVLESAVKWEQDLGKIGEIWSILGFDEIQTRIDDELLPMIKKIGSESDYISFEERLKGLVDNKNVVSSLMQEKERLRIERKKFIQEQSYFATFDGIIKAKNEVLNIREQIEKLRVDVLNLKKMNVEHRIRLNKMIVKFWDRCLDLAQDNQQCEAAEWLAKRGAKRMKKKEQKLGSDQIIIYGE